MFDGRGLSPLEIGSARVLLRECPIVGCTRRTSRRTGPCSHCAPKPKVSRHTVPIRDEGVRHELAMDEEAFAAELDRLR